MNHFIPCYIHTVFYDPGLQEAMRVRAESIQWVNEESCGLKHKEEITFKYESLYTMLLVQNITVYLVVEIGSRKYVSSLDIKFQKFWWILLPLWKQCVQKVDANM